jgi:PHD/YefM family antitoxin component YafN of YafNO toxin-antitoxin module
MSLVEFDLDANLRLSELRQEGRIEESLQVHQRVRVQRRGDLVGVLVSPEAWRAIVAELEELQRTVARYVEEAERAEDAAARALIEARTLEGDDARRLTMEELLEIDRNLEGKYGAETGADAARRR